MELHEWVVYMERIEAIVGTELFARPAIRGLVTVVAFDSSVGTWTGLVTEMDKVGSIGEIKTGAFYTRDDWGKPDQPSIWGQGVPSNLSKNIDFVFVNPDGIWGSDDDTDIEYIYQELLYSNKKSILTGEEIREGWLAHIKKEEENYLWVSNQKAFDLMHQGMVPPATGDQKIILNLR